MATFSCKKHRIECGTLVCFAGEFDSDKSLAHQMKVVESVTGGWKNCLDEFQSAYLSRSLSRLFDVVQLALSNKKEKEAKLSTQEEISAIISKSNSFEQFDYRILSICSRDRIEAAFVQNTQKLVGKSEIVGGRIRIEAATKIVFRQKLNSASKLNNSHKNARIET